MSIAVIPMSLGNPWWIRAQVGSDKFADDFKVEVIFTSTRDEDPAGQLNVFNDMITRGVSAITLAAVDVESMKQPISDTISQKNLPVFGFDVGAPGTDTLFLASGWEPESSGYAIGKGCAEEIGGKGKVVVMTGPLGSTFLETRKKAIYKALEEYPDIEVVGEIADCADIATALTKVEAILQANPDIAGFAGTVTQTPTLVAQACDNLGITTKPANWGVGLPNQNAEIIKKGQANGILALDPAKMTYLGVLMVYNYLTTGALPKEGDDFGWASEGAKVLVYPELKAAYVGDILLTPENVDSFGF